MSQQPPPYEKSGPMVPMEPPMVPPQTAYGAPPVGQTAYGAPPVGQTAYGAPPVAQTAYGAPPVAQTVYAPPAVVMATPAVVQTVYQVHVSLISELLIFIFFSPSGLAPAQ